MATSSSSGDDDIERLLREMQQLSDEAEAVTSGKPVPARRDDALERRRGTPPQGRADGDAEDDGSSSALRRAVVVSAISAVLVTLVISIPLGVVGILLPALLEWAVAAFAGGLGVALYYSWRHRE